MFHAVTLGYAKSMMINSQQQDSTPQSNDILSNSISSTTTNSTVPEEPRSYEHAMMYPEWEASIKSELNSLISNGTWELIDQPMNEVILPNQWIFKIKRKKDNSIERYKSRLVVGGHRQIKGINYDETFAPVVRLDTLDLC
jgi:hypothetical protein